MHYTPPANTGLSIIYQDRDLLVLDKPAGLLSVPGRGEDKQDSLSTRVQAEYPEARIVHRLDMATSGLMLMARNDAMQRELSMMFEQKQIEKQYIAIVDGLLEPQGGIIDLPLITDWPNRPRQIVEFNIGKPSLTNYHVLEHNERQHCSRISLRPLTGRTHQLRVHLQAIGHAILGDPLYATKKVCGKSDRLLLHAETLEFVQAATRKTVKFTCKSPF